jgi:hypothetical protein
MSQTKIYVASSWKNEHQPAVVAALRTRPFDVYDFKDPAMDTGFHWSKIDGHWSEWTPERYKKALQHPLAEAAYLADKKALDEADICVLVLPSGRSASWEFGYHFGRTGRPGIVYMPPDISFVASSPELMYREAIITSSLDEVVEAACDMKIEIMS